MVRKLYGIETFLKFSRVPTTKSETLIVESNKWTMFYTIVRPNKKDPFFGWNAKISSYPSAG